MKDNKTVDLKSKDECCGCSACESICPAKAIKMIADEEGFLYPMVDKIRCIGCGKCETICSFRKTEMDCFEPKAFGIKHKQINERIESRSGAAFVGFADIILKNKGIIYGAALQKDFSVKHIRATSLDERKKIQKVKYVQSDTRYICEMVFDDLRNGYEVLFTGTPCQVAALKTYLKEKKASTNKLVCCDMVCHGVPSPLIWKEYLNYIEEKYKSGIEQVNFRDKEFGWDSHFESFRLRRIKKKVVTNYYGELFSKGVILRPACHNCPYASIHRIGDLTMADFWGIEKVNPSFNDNLGVSLVLVNSEKGMNLLRMLQNEFDMFSTSIEEVIQPRMKTPSQPALNRKEFWADYREKDFGAVLKKYTRPDTKLGTMKKIIKEGLYYFNLRRHP